VSTIASFTRLPLGALPGLRDEAIPKKRFLKSPLDTYPEYLATHGQEVVEYPWPGFVLATLLVFLEEEFQIDLMKSAHDELATFLAEARRATTFVLALEHKEKYLEKLAAPVSADRLRDYYNGFNEVDEPDSGVPMQDGIRAFREALEQVDENSVIVLQIG